MKLKYLKKLKNLIPFCFLFIGTLALPQPSLAEEKIEVTTIIQSSKGLSGKNFNYLEGKPELRLFKVKIPVGLKTPIHTHPSSMLIQVSRGRLKHVRGEEINFFKAGDAFMESNNGGSHYAKNVGKKPAIIHVGVVSVVGVPTAIKK
ncbi:cupin domain-containing protein [Prochlorococcus sp. AH-716-B03]|nr:cupin domain-containing protein [Prochlorococcus sp. AH-716-B03]